MEYSLTGKGRNLSNDLSEMDYLCRGSDDDGEVGLEETAKNELEEPTSTDA